MKSEMRGWQIICAVMLVVAMSSELHAAYPSCNDCIARADTIADLACQVDDLEWEKTVLEMERQEVHEDILTINYCIVLLYQMPQEDRGVAWQDLLQQCLEALIPMYERRDTLVSEITDVNNRLELLNAEIHRFQTLSAQCPDC